MVNSASSLVALARQFVAFFWVGIVAAIVHFGLLIGLVEGGHAEPVPATLVGFVAGGVVSYLLNRRHTYASERPHQEAGWRFAVVAIVGFGLTWLAMSALVGRLALPYLPAQVVTTGLVLVWSFLAHKYWSFGQAR